VRICLYTSTALPLVGGQETVVDALARRFVHAGHDVAVLAPRPSRVRDLGDETLPYSVFRHPRFVSTWRFVSWYRWWLRRLSRQWAFDVVHAHDVYPTGYLASLLRDRLRCPLVITSHDGDVVGGGPRLGRPGVRAAHVMALANASCLIAISRAIRDAYVRLLPDAAAKIILLPNGVEVGSLRDRVARPADLDASIRTGRYLLFLGRLTHRKGADLILHALSRVAAGEGVELVLAGDGPERGTLEQLTADLNLAQRVRFVGLVSGERKRYLLQNASCLVVPSRLWEGMPLVVLEGFAAGRPVIASQLVGMDDVISDGQTGFLVPPESPEALAAQLEAALRNPAQMDTCGARAQAVAAAYGWDAIAARHLHLYAEVGTAASHVPQSEVPLTSGRS